MDDLALADQPNAKTSNHERLLAVLATLRREMDSEAASSSLPDDLSAAHPTGTAGLGRDDESLVIAIRKELAGLAASSRDAPRVAPASLQGALDGVEFVLRSDLVNGRHDRLPSFMAGFVFLVLLPVSGKAEALRSARRVGSLLAQRT